MRILHVVHGFPPHHRHGAELSTLDLARQQLSDGHEVHVLAGERGRLTRELAFERSDYEEIPVTRVWFNPRSENGFLGHEGFEDRMRALLRDLRADVVHIQHLKNLSLSVIRAARAEGVPTVLTLRDYGLLCERVNLVRGNGELCRHSDMTSDCHACVHEMTMGYAAGEKAAAAALALAKNLPKPRSWKLLAGMAARALTPAKPPVALETPADFARRFDTVREALAQVDAITAITADLAERFERFARRGLGVTALHQAPDTSACRLRIREPRRGRPLRVGYVGKVTYVKGVHVLLEAARRFDPAELEVEVWGGPTWTDILEIAHWRRVAALAGDRANIQLHPEGFPREELADVYDRFDVLAVPSIWFEAYGRIVAEAFANGVPVVCSDEGGPAELVRSGEDGYTVAMGDVDAWEATLRRLVEDPEEAARLSRNVRPLKAPDVYAAEVHALYERVSDEGGRRG